MKDRLGQRLFGDNTFLATLDDTVSGDVGKRYCASFRFRMPTLPVGAYSVDAAIASGTQNDHTQQHWSTMP
ncbi:Wzt carbohydrate-binding domain-containing protein [Cupriavidus basilensis]